MKVKLISTTTPCIPECKTAEELIMYCARVSSSDQTSHDTKLIKYCIEHEHWSIFEMAGMCVEIVTSRAISPQILRHKSFQFQEFSQRYANVTEFEEVELRLQGDSKQGSGEVVKHVGWVKDVVDLATFTSNNCYNDLINAGISRETARMILPLCTQTKLYMSGTVRSWIHYINVRTKLDTQKEHRLIAEEIKQIFVGQFPIISKTMEWC